MLVSEAEGHVDVPQHQERRVAVLLTIFLKVSHFVLMATPINVRLVIQGSVCAKLKEVFSQRIARVINSKCSVNAWDNTILCACLASKREWNITYTFIKNTVGENIFVALNSHDEGPEVEIAFWTGLVPHL